MRQSHTYTPEERAASAERLRKLWQDPEWRARREAGVRAAAERGVQRKVNSESMKREWADPVKRKRRLNAMAEAMEVNRPKHRATLLALKADPAFEEKRARKAQEYKDRNPLRMKVSALHAAKKRRGFDVPAHLWKEYRFLVDKKSLTAREAGAVLGLVRP